MQFANLSTTFGGTFLSAKIVTFRCTLYFVNHLGVFAQDAVMTNEISVKTVFVTDVPFVQNTELMCFKRVCYITSAASDRMRLQLLGNF